MSINIFKKHPGNKVTFSNRAIFSGELKIMRSRPKMIFCVHGSRECRMSFARAAICFLLCRSKKHERHLQITRWKLNYEDVVLFASRALNHSSKVSYD